MRRPLLVILAVLTLFGGPASALAADPTPTPTLSPSADPTPGASIIPVEITANPGELGAFLAPVPVIATGPSARGGTFRVANPSTLAERFTITVADYTINAAGEVDRDDNGNPTTDVPGYAYGSAPWYSFPEDEFVLEPGTGREVRFNLDVPLDAVPGDHVTALIVTFRALDAEPDGSTPKPGVGLKTVATILTRLQHTVAGALPGTPEVSLTATTDDAGVHFVASVNNTGNTVIDYKTGKAGDPLPVFEIYPVGSDSKVACLTQKGGFYVLPTGNRIVTLDWLVPKPTESPTPTPVVSQDPCDNPALPPTGDYRAVFVLPARDGRPEYRPETTFHFVNTAPVDNIGLYLALGLFAVLLAVLMVGAFLLLSRRRRRDEDPEERQRG